MSRASRLAEIAKANEPAFTGAHWWLADPSAKPDPVQQAAPSVPSGTPAAELVSVAVHNVEAQVSIAEAAPVRAVEVENPPILASKMTGFRERFLWLGRRSRGVASA
jgi:hypothetical protein